MKDYYELLYSDPEAAYLVAYREMINHPGYKTRHMIKDLNVAYSYNLVVDKVNKAFTILKDGGYSDQEISEIEARA